MKTGFPSAILPSNNLICVFMRSSFELRALAKAVTAHVNVRKFYCIEQAFDELMISVKAVKPCEAFDYPTHLPNKLRPSKTRFD